MNGGSSPPSTRGALAFVFQVPPATCHPAAVPCPTFLSYGYHAVINLHACLASWRHLHVRCTTLSAWSQELTRQETHLYVHACTAVPPHFLPLVATRLQLPAQVRLLYGAASATSWC